MNVRKIVVLRDARMCMRVWRGAVAQSIKGEDGVLYVVRAQGLIETAFFNLFFLSLFDDLSSIQYLYKHSNIDIKCILN